MIVTIGWGTVRETVIGATATTIEIFFSRGVRGGDAFRPRPGSSGSGGMIHAEAAGLMVVMVVGGRRWEEAPTTRPLLLIPPSPLGQLHGYGTDALGHAGHGTEEGGPSPGQRLAWAAEVVPVVMADEP